MRKRLLFLVLAFVGLVLSCLASFVYPRVCVCASGLDRLWCFRCRHFSAACSRFWPKNEFGQRVPRFRSSCLIDRKLRDVQVISCPTCNFNNVHHD